MTLLDALAAGEFALTAELTAPVNPDAELVRAGARSLAPFVHAANITDNQAASVKLPPVASAVWLLDEGLEPIVQLTTRDRNLLALQAELLGAFALGVRTILALSGDPLHVGKYEETATHVRDLDSSGLARLVGEMNEGRLAAGEELDTPTELTVLSAANPLVDSLERLEQKLDAGVKGFQTNIVYDVDRFADWFGPLVEAGVSERAPVLVGVMPPRSTRALQYMHDNIPGVEVDAATFGRMEDLEGEEARAAGVAIATDIVERVRGLPGVAGVHLMAPGWEADAVPRVVRGAGLAGPAAT